MKLLIDECLSENLAKVARARGHLESSHVRWIGKSGAKDWELLPAILGADWTFVTKNSVDFRGPADLPGSRGLYPGAAVHAGLNCLNGPVGMDLRMPLELFEAALDALLGEGDLVNAVLEVTLEAPNAADLAIVRYSLPRETAN